MAMIKTPAYFKWRDGRPRWEPGPGLRNSGFRGRDLKSAGSWLELGPAINAAQALNEEVAQWRAGALGDASPPPRHRRKTQTIEGLYERWLASPKFARLRSSTQYDYKNKAAVFLATFGAEQVAALAPHHLYKWWEELYAARGHAMANGILAVARAILSHAPRIGWRADNPARNLGLDTVPPRVVVWSPSEVSAFIKLADAQDRHGLADAVIIALHTGQRQGDVLRLTDPKIENGRCIFQQSKRGARVAVPFTDALARRFEAIRARRATLTGVVDLNAARRLVLRPDGGIYRKERLGKHFRRIREQVAIEHPEFTAKTFADLRDTAVTRLALAGCTVPEIRAITGHSMQTVHQVMQHYLALDDRMAATGINRLKTWMEAEGIAL